MGQAVPIRGSRRVPGYNWRRHVLQTIAGRARLWVGNALVFVFVSIVGAATAQSAPPALRDGVVRIGFVAPLPIPGAITFRPESQVALSALRGVQVAVDEAAPQDAGGQPLLLELRISNAPTLEAAIRAAERMILFDRVSALVGGIGPGQAAALCELARRHNVLFFNVGALAQEARSVVCDLRTFHMEATSAMYVDALVAYYSRAVPASWFIVSTDDDEGARLAGEALGSIARSEGASVSKVVLVPSGQFVYSSAISEIVETNADAVLVLLGYEQQEFFLAQVDAVLGDSVPPIALLPHSETQSRPRMAALRESAPIGSLHPRVALWDAAYRDGEAARINDRFSTRWASPMDPSAWSGFLATHLFANGLATATTEQLLHGEILACAIRQRAFEPLGQNAWTVSFRPEDHQLQQPMLVLQIDSGAQWAQRLSSQVAIADVLDVLPPSLQDTFTTPVDGADTHRGPIIGDECGALSESDL